MPDKQKFPETHYEYTLREYSRDFGRDVIETIRESILENGSDLRDPLSTLDLSFAIQKLWVSGGLDTDLLSDIDNTVIQNEIRSFSTILRYLWAFSKQKKIYRFEEGITTKLLHTEISKIDSLFLRSPYNTIYITVPYNTEVTIPNSMTGDHVLKALYISLTDIEADGKTDPIKHLQFLAIGKGKVVEGLVHDDAVFFGSLPVCAGDIISQLNQHLLAQKIDTKAYESADKIFKFILNALLYLTSSNCQENPIRAAFTPLGRVKSKSYKLKVLRKNKGLSKLGHISVGRDIKLSPEWRQLQQVGASGQPSDQVISVPRWLVQGHWRNQVCGPGRSKHKLIWIEPHEKGKGLDESLVNKGYIVT